MGLTVIFIKFEIIIFYFCKIIYMNNIVCELRAVKYIYL